MNKNSHRRKQFKNFLSFVGSRVFSIISIPYNEFRAIRWSPLRFLYFKRFAILVERYDIPSVA